MQREPEKEIAVMLIETGNRFLPVSDKDRAAMAKSLDEYGLQVPISVRRVTSEDYRVIAGATRLLAARDLGWSKIRAVVVSGTADELLEHELVENVDRKNLTAAQRKAVQKKLRELRRERVAAEKAKAPPSKGGRGKRGGLREASRQAGVPRSTAQRDDGKPAHNDESGPVSVPSVALPKGRRSPLEECPDCGCKRYRQSRGHAAA